MCNLANENRKVRRKSGCPCKFLVRVYDKKTGLHVKVPR